MTTMTHLHDRRVTRLWVTLVAAMLWAGPAYAQDERKLKEARDRYEKGQAAYNLGRFDEAIAEFEKGYLAKPDPVFLFNIAQSYRQVSNFDKAIFFYKRYLGTAKDAPNRADVENRIVELEGLKKKEEQDKLKTEKEKGDQEKAERDRVEKERLDKERGERERLEREKDKLELEKIRLEKDRLEKDRLERDKADKEKAAALAGGAGAGNPNVAMVGGGASGNGSSVRAGGGGSGVFVVAPAPPKQGPIRLRAAGAPAFVNFSADLKVTLVGSYWLGGAYALSRGKLALELGVDTNMTWIIYNVKSIDPDNPEKTKNVPTAAPWLGAFARLAARYSLTPRFSLGVEVGAGMYGWTALGDGNPFTTKDPETAEGVAATGPVPMLATRAGLALELQLAKGISAFVIPSYTVIQLPDGLLPKFTKFSKMEAMVGVGYSL